MRVILLIAAVTGFAVQLCTGAGPKTKEGDALRRAVQDPTVENLPLLLNAVQDSSHCFPKRSDASLAVTRLGKKAVPEIVAMVKRRRTKVWTSQVDNLFLLTEIGPDAAEVLPVLKEIVESPTTHRYVRHFAETAQAAIQEDLTELTRLAVTGVDFGHAALREVEKWGVEARAAGPMILELARKKPSSKRRYLAALEVIDPRLAEDLATEIINQ